MLAYGRCLARQLHRQILPYLKHNLRWGFANRNIPEQLLDYVEKLNQELQDIHQKQDQFVQEYIDLAEESFLESLKDTQKGKQVDPQFILLVLPTLVQDDSIRSHLLMLYPHLDALNPKELQLFLEYMVTHKLTLKPAMPKPRNLKGAETILVLLNEIFAADFLGEWLKMIPVYEGSNLYTLSMGFFAIYEKMSPKCKERYASTIYKCQKKIKTLYYSQNEDEVKVGVIMLAFEMNNSLGECLLLEEEELDLLELDPQKICLFIINLQKYIQKYYGNVKNKLSEAEEEEQDEGEEFEEEKQQGDTKRKEKEVDFKVYDPSNQVETKHRLNRLLSEALAIIVKQDWKDIIKLNIFMEFYSILSGMKKIEVQWKEFSEKLFEFTKTNEQIAVMESLSTSEIVSIIEILEMHRVNHPILLKRILTTITNRLETAEKQHLMRLAKCLVTYVRQVEDYLIGLRLIIQKRKHIFSPNDIRKVNQSFARVQVLFPKPIQL